MSVRRFNILLFGGMGVFVITFVVAAIWLSIGAAEQHEAECQARGWTSQVHDTGGKFSQRLWFCVDTEGYMRFPRALR